ncbi:MULTISPECIES: glycosyltransferase family 1 protein [unclassified Tatumella]|uniref:glycosyltransferase family 4 protein n=1 Tax=unclassified Tatumella TaxID=2649542 RepID=UPI001BAEEE5E|nr:MULTISPECIES: glycosyltransferase family 1 protein [unclassified Tatumella]MBS0857078.1 glycosyltransferase family 4 protein [Tatumella sp. JGM16]MBS0913811.1 glycosyltransferase family 4 protein [Tatumella sp. JGM91]
MPNNKIYIDPRWEGMGGIGTFYQQINRLNEYPELAPEGHPASPLDTFRSAKALKDIKDAVMFFPGYIPPLVTKVPFVITIHDLNHLDRPENSSKSKHIFYNTVIKRGCRQAAYVFTVSEFSRQRIIDWAGIPAGKVINVGNGVSEYFSPEGARMNYDFEYLLCVSNRKGHKNETGTLKAFKEADIDESIKLVFTGKADTFITEKIAELGLQNRVVFTGYLAEEDLPLLYRTAKGLIFVSFYEGFGLPVIEAMASAVPVITADNTSLAEVSGGAALLTNAEDTQQIAEAITRIFTEPELVAELKAKGLVNATRYSWKKTAAMVDEHLKKISV